MHQVRQMHQPLKTMSKATLIQLKEDAKAMTQAHVFSETLWKNKRQKTQPTPPRNSPLTEEGVLFRHGVLWDQVVRH
jgi:hypothetical protein